LLSEYDAVQEMNNRIVISYADRFAAIKALFDAGTIQKEEAAQREQELNQEVALGKLNAYAAALSGIGEMVGKETGLAKAAAIAATLINTYAAAQSAAKNPPGPPGSFAYVAAAVASGLANLMKIRSVKTSFARGVIGLQGAGTETSDSIDARLSRGESVLTAKATKRYAPQLAAMEWSVGNQPNYQLGSRRFASGIIAAGMGAGDTITAQRRMVTDIMSELRAIKVYVVEKDITATQGRARRVNVMGDI
jgi:hypothetical protein